MRMTSSRPCSRQGKLDVDPVGGEETERLVADLFKLDPALIARLRTILLQ